jgi:hypothetical protein
MASTHTSLHFHLIFATKDRFPLIAKEWQLRLHAYLGGLVRHLGGVPDEINGMTEPCAPFGGSASHPLPSRRVTGHQEHLVQVGS